MRRMIVLGVLLLCVASNAFAAEYVTEKGDTPEGICRRLGHTLHQLQAMNLWVQSFKYTDELTVGERILHVTPREEELAIERLEANGFFKRREEEREKEFAHREEKAEASVRKGEPHAPFVRPDPVPNERRFATCYSPACSTANPDWVHFTEVLRLAQVQMEEERKKVKELPTHDVVLNALIILPVNK